MLDAVIFAAKVFTFIMGSITILGSACMLWMLLAQMICEPDTILPKEVDMNGE